jgi:hypothetical protein
MDYQLYHDYFRPHEALNGKTPAENCGIIIGGQNKWKTVKMHARNKGDIKVALIRSYLDGHVVIL